MFPMAGESIIEESISIHGPQDVVRVEARVRELARCLGFNARKRWQMAVAVTEAALGLLGSEGGGVIKLRCRAGLGGCLEFETVEQGSGEFSRSQGRKCGPRGSGPLLKDLVGAIARMMDEICLTDGGGGVSLIARKFLDLGPANGAA